MNTVIIREQQAQLMNSAGMDTNCPASLNVIIGIDFTSSNEWKGRRTFSSQSLHKTLGNKIYNPYQKVISVLGMIINRIICTNLFYSGSNQQTSTQAGTGYSAQSQPNASGPLRIYSFGFGDMQTTDKGVFPLFDQSCYDSIHDNRVHPDLYCVDSFDEVLNRYRFPNNSFIYWLLNWIYHSNKIYCLGVLWINPVIVMVLDSVYFICF